MGTSASIQVTEDEISDLVAESNFTSKEIPKLINRFSWNNPRAKEDGITLKDFLDIPEISSNPIMPTVGWAYLDSETNKLMPKSFIRLLSNMSVRNSVDAKKRFAFQVLDSDSDGQLSFRDLFSLYRLVTGPTLTDNHIIETITSILNRQELQQPGRLSFDEFARVVSDEEIEALFTVELQLS